MRFSLRTVVLGVAAFVLAAGTAFAAYKDYGNDFGLKQQSELRDESQNLFGVGKPLASSSNVDLDAAQALANPAGLITVAKGLKVKVVSAGKAGANIDQMVL